MKLKNSNGDETQKLKLWSNSKTQILIKKNLKTWIVMKLKNSNCDETQNLKLWQNSKAQIMTKLLNSNCDKLKTQSNRDKTNFTKKLKL